MRCVALTAATPGHSTEGPLRCRPAGSRDWASPSSPVLCEQAPQPEQKIREVFREEKVLTSDIQRERRLTSNQSLEEQKTERTQLARLDLLQPLKSHFLHPQPASVALTDAFLCVRVPFRAGRASHSRSPHPPRAPAFHT